MIITTTNNVEGYRIVHYLPPVAANVVVGTGLFSDVAASFTDVFGGRSESYQRQLDAIYAQASAELQNKATSLGANCVVGAKFDFGEISGKGMQMLMLTAVGTPVVIKTDQEIAAEANAAAAQKAEHEREVAARRERFEGATSLVALLADPTIAQEARDMRRIYGAGVCLSYLKRKADELGLDGIDLSQEDLPATF